MKRTYVGELEWALEQVNIVLACDRNPNRETLLHVAIEYGLAVAIARRSHAPLPEQPDMTTTT